uniref:Uncharacterized protein n=1 Tax=Tanacetum cinerariifolium TaxID=118510 RepID=A0A699IAK5_TANCI|nr:hypothetical protein [Tanacetum cinerariifolium]
MARQYPKPKRKRDVTWFKNKVLLVEAQRKGKVLNKEKLEILADLGIAEGPVTQSILTHNAACQADDLDAYDSDCDEISTAKAVLMANLSSYGSNVFSEVPYSDNTHNDMLSQSVQEMSYFEQTHLVNYPDNEITSDSNIIPYSRYLLETQNTAVHDTNSYAQQDAMILSVFEQLSNQVTNCNKVNKDNLIANETLSAELERYKKRVPLIPVAKEICLPCTGCKVTLPSLMVACCLGFHEFLSWLLVVGKRDVTTADRNDIIWLMASMGSSPCLNTGIVRPKSSW